MEHLSVTPFGRSVSAGQLAARALAQTPSRVQTHDKWELFRALCAARHAFGVTDRDLSVLNALLSFHKGRALEAQQNLIVFPSNAALSERAHGMAESTLRRHLAALGRAGLILRHDSPNGKRYAARGRDGSIARAFGFDLGPLLARAEDILQAARAAADAAQALKRARERTILRLRDVRQLSEFALDEGLDGDWEEALAEVSGAQRMLRRKLMRAEVEQIAARLDSLFTQISTRLDLLETNESHVNAGQNERHKQNSNPESYDSEPCPESGGAGGSAAPQTPALHPAAQLERAREAEPPRHPSAVPQEETERKSCPVPLALVLKACPEIQLYGGGEIAHWHQLVAAAGFVRGMMGISPDAWEGALRTMGPEVASVTVACILQRVDRISAPGGYLRALTQKSASDGFSVGPMVMALLGNEGRQAA